MEHRWTKFVRKLKALPPREWPPYLLSKLTMIWRRLCMRLESGNAEDHSVEVPEAMLVRNRQLYKIGVREFIAYRPRRFAGRIAVFRTADPPFDMCDPLPLWKRLTEGVDVFTVAGTHGTIMEDRHVTSVARQLSRYLGGAEGCLANDWEDQTEAHAAAAAAPSDERRQQATT